MIWVTKSKYLVPDGYTVAPCTSSTLELYDEKEQHRTLCYGRNEGLWAVGSDWVKLEEAHKAE